MTIDGMTVVSIAIFIVAFLYSSVGHAGASGYIAILTLWNFVPETIRPIALTLNIVVASIATWHFYRAGYFDRSLFIPFAVMSIPFAFLGGSLDITPTIFHVIVGVVLLYSSVRFFLPQEKVEQSRPPALAIALPTGAGLGFLSGLTGVGGGIFLTPLLLLMKWSKTKTAAAISAPFILVNSISGLISNVIHSGAIPHVALPFSIAAIAGGWLGSFVGSKILSPFIIKKLLAVVLCIAGIKLLVTA